MTGEHDFDEELDRDEALRTQLAAVDPARSLGPAGMAGMARLLEEIMSHDTDVPVPAVTEPTENPRRNPLLLLAAAAVFVVAGVGFVAAARSSGEDPPQAESPSPSVSQTAPTTTVLTAPAAAAGRCAVPTPELIAASELAFAGTVTATDDSTVTLETTTAYAGEVGDQVEVQAPSATLLELLGATSFVVGDDYLVSATAGVVSVCGLSGPATSELQQLYEAAFPA